MEQHIAGYILAGGKNLRMEGRKKLFLTFGEKSFFQYLREGLSPLDKLYVSVEQEASYEAIEEELIVDVYEGVGPLGAILSGLLKCKEEALLTVPCDMVPFPAELIGKMLAAYEEKQCPVMVKTGDHLLPFPGIYTKAMIPQLSGMIADHRYRVTDLWKNMKEPYTVLKVDDVVVHNVNTKEEYDILKGRKI